MSKQENAMTLVERLREMTLYDECLQAADEIERLETLAADRLGDKLVEVARRDKRIAELMAHWNAELVHSENCRKRIAELESALRDMFVLVDEGFLCRDISRDAESGWAIRQLGFVQRLAKAKQALGERDDTD